MIEAVKSRELAERVFQVQLAMLQRQAWSEEDAKHQQELLDVIIPEQKQFGMTSSGEAAMPHTGPGAVDPKEQEVIDLLARAGHPVIRKRVPKQEQDGR